MVKMGFGVDLVIIIVSIVLLIMHRIKLRQQYWLQRGFPHLKPSFPFGNMGNPFNRKKHLGLIVQDMYNEIKQMGAKHGGVSSLFNPVYLPVDPDYLKYIMQKDFNYFYDRGFYYNEKDDPLSAHLFAISGTKWRNLRTKLTPTFTSGKIKMMFETLVQCSVNMVDAMRKYDGSNEGIDAKDALARYTTDVIGSCAFGLDCNSFKDEDAEFRKYGKAIFEPESKLNNLLNVFMFSKPDLARKLGLKLTPKKTREFFINVVKDTVKYREQNNVKRNDMLQLLTELKDVESDGKRRHDGKALSINEIAAQAYVFFIAGFETSSTTMTFCLYELACNHDIQQKVRNEINSVLAKHGEKFTYECIMDLKYMGQVIDETLRKYPPLAFITRECVEDYHVPDTNLIVEKGLRLFIPVYALHHDPEYFPNPEVFDPERFSEDNKPTIRPFSYIPFGEGPRICIGLRFGIMQVKVGLAALLKKYIFSLNHKTATSLVIDPRNFILTAQEGIWLDIKNVKKAEKRL